jgi:hypothetical protein
LNNLIHIRKNKLEMFEIDFKKVVDNLSAPILLWMKTIENTPLWIVICGPKRVWFEENLTQISNARCKNAAILKQAKS